jgi:hypothetical protein
MLGLDGACPAESGRALDVHPIERRQADNVDCGFQIDADPGNARTYKAKRCNWAGFSEECHKAAGR